MAKDFYDEFNTQTILSRECVAKLDEELRQEVSKGSPAEAAFSNYKDTINKLLGAQGTSLEAARQDNPNFIYLEAAVDMQQFQALLGQTTAAVQCASKAAADAEAAKAQGEQVRGDWEPPAEDEEPETALDYQ